MSIEPAPNEPHTAAEKKLNPWLKFTLELGPLLIFFFANSRGERLADSWPLITALGGPIFFATAAFVVATVVALGVSYALTRHLPLMPFVTAIVASGSDVSREVLQKPVLEPTLGTWTLGGIDVAGTFAGIRQVVNALFSAATVALVLALASRAAIGATQEVNQGRPLTSRERHADLHELLLAAAAVLVSIVITMAAWLTWPKAGLADDSAAFLMLDHLAQGVGLYWGGVFSLSLALAYLPSVAYLKHLEGRGAADAAEDGAGGRQVKLLQDVVALLSPFISALVPVFLI